MKVLDLFSGIGGFSLGLERAGMQTVAFCEIDPFCRRVLAKHWPGVPIYGDIRELWAAKGFADVVVGGFPCQPFSSASAGNKRGTEDDRYLWPQMLRIVSHVRPAWVIVENVAAIDGMALEQVVSDMEAEGYAVATLEIPACAVGHPHRRNRVWICCHTNRNGQSGLSLNEEMAWLQVIGRHPRGMGAHHGIPSRMDRLRALGNAVVPQIPELIGRAILESEARIRKNGVADETRTRDNRNHNP